MRFPLEYKFKYPEIRRSFVHFLDFSIGNTWAFNVQHLSLQNGAVMTAHLCGFKMIPSIPKVLCNYVVIFDAFVSLITYSKVER